MVWLRRIAETISALLFGAMFVFMIAGVAARYVFNTSIAWIDELVVVFFLWSIFWTSALVIRNTEHVSFDILYEHLSLNGRRWLIAIGFGAVGLLFLACLPTVVDYILFLRRESTPVLRLRLDVIYSCFALFLAAAAVRLLFQAGRMFSKSWKSDVTASQPSVPLE